MRGRPVPAHLEAVWPCLRLVADGVVSWTDLSSMSLDDVLDLSDAVAFIGQERTPARG